MGELKRGRGRPPKRPAVSVGQSPAFSPPLSYIKKRRTQRKYLKIEYRNQANSQESIQKLSQNPSPASSQSDNKIVESVKDGGYRPSSEWNLCDDYPISEKIPELIEMFPEGMTPEEFFKDVL